MQSSNLICCRKLNCIIYLRLFISKNFACIYLIMDTRHQIYPIFLQWEYFYTVSSFAKFNKRCIVLVHDFSHVNGERGWKYLNNFMFTHAADDYALQTRPFEIANRVNILVSQYNGDKTFVDQPIFIITGCVPFHRSKTFGPNCTEWGVLCVLRFSTPSHQLTFYWSEHKFYWCHIWMMMSKCGWILVL